MHNMFNVSIFFSNMWRWCVRFLALDEINKLWDTMNINMTGVQLIFFVFFFQTISMILTIIQALFCNNFFMTSFLDIHSLQMFLIACCTPMQYKYWLWMVDFTTKPFGKKFTFLSPVIKLNNPGKKWSVDFKTFLFFKFNLKKQILFNYSV